MGRVPICLHLGWASLSLDSPARWPCPLSTGIGGNRAPSPHLQVGCVFHIFSLDLIGWGGDLLINFRVPLLSGLGVGYITTILILGNGCLIVVDYDSL